MPFSDLTQLNSSDTFQTVFTRNNEMILKLNDLEVGSLRSDGSIILSEIGSTGGITLGVNFEKIIGVSGSFNLLISGPVPGGLTLNSAIGISGSGFGKINTMSAENSRKFLGFISGVSGSDSYTITTSGRIKNSSLQDNTLYYLDEVGGITSNRPTSSNSVIKPILFNINSTIGGIVLQQNEIVVSEAATSYIKSSSRTLAEITTNGSISVGNVVYYDVSGSTWAKSQANEAKKSEVFGIVESIGGITATIVTHGSINIPANILNSVGDGGAGGNDIWFLSAITGGHLQNLAPSSIGTIVKPVYYNYPHQFAGNTFSGYLINYIGYAAGGSVGEEQNDTSGIKIGEFKQVSFHGNRLGMKDWLHSLRLIIQGTTQQVTTESNQYNNYRISVPYDIGVTKTNGQLTTQPDSRIHLEDYIDKNFIELSGALLLVEEPAVNGNGIAVENRCKITEPAYINSLLMDQYPANSLLPGGLTYDTVAVDGKGSPLDKFIECGVKSILKIKTKSDWKTSIQSIDYFDRWSQLKRLYFSSRDIFGKPHNIINWTNVSLLKSDSNTITSGYGDFVNFNGLDFDRVKEILIPQDEYNNFKRNLLTSFYLPGFIIEISDQGIAYDPEKGPIPQHPNKRTQNQDGNNLSFITRMAVMENITQFGNADNNNHWFKMINTDFVSSSNPLLDNQLFIDGIIPIVSPWMTSEKYTNNTSDSTGADPSSTANTYNNWQEIGCIIRVLDPNLPININPRRFLFIYSPYWAITNNVWDIDKIDLESFFSNIYRIPGKNNLATPSPASAGAGWKNISWPWLPRVWNPDNSSWYNWPPTNLAANQAQPVTTKLCRSVPANSYNINSIQGNVGWIEMNEQYLLKNVIGIHLPDYSNGSPIKTLMRVI